MEAGRVSAVTGQQGYQEGIIFAVFAAAVIGGVSLQGGRGKHGRRGVRRHPPRAGAEHS